MLSKDPVKRGLNPYPYCDNDPANYTDPTGEVANILAGGIVGGTIGFAWGFAGSAISQRMSGRRVDWRRAAGAGINGAVIGAVRGAMTASGVGAAAAFAGNFAAGTAGSALEQWIGTGNVSARRSVAGGLINAVNNAVYKDYVFKSGTQALKKGFLAGGARAGIEYLSETLGKPSKYDRNRRSARRSYMPESRDPRMSCGREDPLGKSLGYSSARGYQYKNPQTNKGFRLGEFIGTVLRGGLMEGLNNLMFFEAGKAVEALGVSVSPHEGKRRSVNGFDTTVNSGRQGKHIVGNNNYIEGRSIFQGGIDDAQRLADEFAGTGVWIGANKERVDFGKVIGRYVNLETGEAVETTIGIIHYSTKGLHIVPAQPR